MKRPASSAEQPAHGHALRSVVEPARKHICSLQVGTTADLDLFIQYVSPRDLVYGGLDVVCRAWLQTHREHAWRSLVLIARAPEDIHLDRDITASHTTVQQFLAAPQIVRERATSGASSLTLNVLRINDLVDHYATWMELNFKKLERLVIQGPNVAFFGMKLKAKQGVRLGLMLRKLGANVKTLVMKVSFVFESTKQPIVTMSTIWDIFGKLEILDVPWPHFGQQTDCLIPENLKCCRGISVDIQNPQGCWLAHAPNLEQLHIDIHPTKEHEMRALSGRAVLDLSLLFSFLKERCPKLHYLNIRFAGYAVLPRDTFKALPPAINVLVLYLGSVAIDGMPAMYHMTLYGQADSPESVCRYLRPLVPKSCNLYILKKPVWTDMENVLDWIDNTGITEKA